MLQKLLRSGQIRINGGRVKSDIRVAPGQTVRIPPQITNLEDNNDASAKLKKPLTSNK